MTSSDSWKAFERRVAKYFGTKRVLRGADFGQSKPDVVANASSFLGIKEPPVDNIYIECKYSQSQYWKSVMAEAKKRAGKRDVLVVTQDIVLWELHATKQFLLNLSAGIGLADVLVNYAIWPVTRSTPGYIYKHLKQCEDYAKRETDSSLSLVCLGQKSSSLITTCAYLNDLIQV